VPKGTLLTEDRITARTEAANARSCKRYGQYAKNSDAYARIVSMISLKWRVIESDRQ